MRRAFSTVLYSQKQYIDSGIALGFRGLDKDQKIIKKMIADSEASNTMAWINICDNPFKTIRSMQSKYSFPIFQTVGFPANFAHNFQAHENPIQHLTSLAVKHRNFVAGLGLLGISEHLQDHLALEIQIQSFEKQLQLAIDLDLPVIVHLDSNYKLILESLLKYQPKTVILNAVTDLNLHNILASGGDPPQGMTLEESSRHREIVDLDQMIKDFSSLKPYYGISHSLNAKFPTNLWSSHLHKIPTSQLLIQSYSPISTPYSETIIPSDQTPLNPPYRKVPRSGTLSNLTLLLHQLRNESDNTFQNQNDVIDPFSRNDQNDQQMKKQQPSLTEFTEEIFQNTLKAFPVLERHVEYPSNRMFENDSPPNSRIINIPLDKTVSHGITPKYPIIDCAVNLSSPSMRSEYARKAIFGEAVANNVIAAININSGLQSFLIQQKNAQKLDIPVYHTVGLSPIISSRWVAGKTKKAIRKLSQLFSHQIAAIGPIGLTGLDGPHSGTLETQIKVFLSQLSLAQELDIPALCHVDTHWDVFFDLLDRHKYTGTLIIRDFHGNPGILQECHNRGFFTSFSASSFDHFQKLKLYGEEISHTQCNFDLCLIESNSPYSIPKELVSKTKKQSNKPANIHYVFSEFYRVFNHNLSQSHLAKLFIANTLEAFPILKKNRVRLDTPRTTVVDAVPTHLSFKYPEQDFQPQLKVTRSNTASKNTTISSNDSTVNDILVQVSFAENMTPGVHTEEKSKLVDHIQPGDMTGVEFDVGSSGNTTDSHHSDHSDPNQSATSITNESKVDKDPGVIRENLLIDAIMTPDTSINRKFPPVIDVGSYLTHNKLSALGLRNVLRDAERYNIRGLISLNPSVATAKEQTTKFQRTTFLSTLSLFHTAGVSPLTSQTWTDNTLKQLESIVLNNPDTLVAIGELGLLTLNDYDDHRSLKHQERILNDQLDFAQSMRLPAVYRVQGQWSRFFHIIKHRGDSGFVPGILLCFGGNSKDLRRALDLGFYVSLNGSITHPSCVNRDILTMIPADRLVVESCSPFYRPPTSSKFPFSPITQDSDINVPSNIQFLVAFLAHRAKMSPYEMAKILFKNTITALPKVRDELLGKQK